LFKVKNSLLPLVISIGRIDLNSGATFLYGRALMFMQPTGKHSFKALLKKILAAFALGSIAIVLAMVITRLSFKELLATVQDLSTPNEKLNILNRVFEEITTLDQTQRAEAIKNPSTPYETFIEQSASVSLLLDSLQQQDWDTTQLARLAEMEKILTQRNEIFFSYLKVKAQILNNREFSTQLDTLSAILQNDNLAIDSTLIKTNKKTTTTYLKDTTVNGKKQQRSLLKKIFARKKNKVPSDTAKIKILEEYSVSVDTLAVARQNDALIELEKIMRQMDRDQRAQRKNLQNQELDLIHSNSQFINQLLGILHAVEKEELQQMKANNEHALQVMSQSITRTNVLTIAFFVFGAILIYLIWIDINRSNYYKQLLEKARDHAEQLSQIKQRFLANMSHELRTPLQSIIGFAEQLKQRDNVPKEEVDAIHSSSEHLLQIVNEVLDYSRISSGSFVIGKEDFNLRDIIQEIDSSIRLQAEQKKLTFVFDIDKNADVLVSGDPFRLRQILYNVLGNAIKFTHRGFVRLIVRVVIEQGKATCVFEISDSGIGIEKNDLDKIFNQFEQANNMITQNYGGTGLGLTIVKALVEAHQGNVALSSEPGLGTTFKIEMSYPLADASKEKQVDVKKITLPESVRKVLIIDDDKLILRLCSLILRKNNIEYELSSSPAEQISQKPLKNVSHILMDIRMPEINGIELCKKLRPKYPAHVKFIALTAHVLPEEKRTLLDIGFDDVLTKPFHEIDLLEKLKSNASQETEYSQPDLSTLRKMTMDDDELFTSIVNQFIEETLSDLVKLKEELSHENALLLRETVHKLAGRFAQVGMTDIAKKIKLIEQKLVDGQGVSILSGEISTIASQIDKTVTEIRLTTLHNLN
jgi:signal transduction histidine kinase/CheY-like chemotaxis protein/HPt (histidine-containing phosphotransfer) domain-containing protein